MKKYEIFLFDADGTLYDYDIAEKNALKTMFDYYGFGYSEEIRLKYREINQSVWESYEKNEITKDELQTIRFKRLFSNSNISCDENEFNEKYIKELSKGSFLIDGALEICKEIFYYNKKIYIVTNGMFQTQKIRFANSMIKDYISDYFISERIGFQKPQPQYFDYVFTHIPQIEKSKILLIGDSITADIVGANSAGIDSCWFNKFGKVNNTDIIPTYEICDLFQLKKFL